MSHDTTDQGWQQIQARVEQLVDRYLRNGLQTIEYKPRDVIHLLEMQKGSGKENPEEAG